MVQLLDIACGAITVPSKLAYIISLVISLIQIFVPILLIVWGMLDLGKAVMAQKEDEIKKGQQLFVKRLIAAAIVFFVVVIVKLLVGLVADDSNNITSCIDNIIKCKTTTCISE
ncbi:MAG: hypothetical protein E7169_04310 [Firmicutes bacterium]|nr:hypothetical protein [Bacillota bacterium]